MADSKKIYIKNIAFFFFQQSKQKPDSLRTINHSVSHILQITVFVKLEGGGGIEGRDAYNDMFPHNLKHRKEEKTTFM